jgi:hypothetical protein
VEVDLADRAHGLQEAEHEAKVASLHLGRWGSLLRIGHGRWAADGWMVDGCRDIQCGFE